MTTFKWFLTILLLTSISAIAQTNRGVGVKIKDRSGKEREIKIYDASYALIIGNSSYKYWDVLNGVKSDVVAVEKALKENGFQVETAIDLDSRSLSPRIEQFVRDHGYEENNRLLIYYAGHGYTQKSVSDDRELGYIVPIDSPSPTKDRVGFLRTAVDLEEIRTFAKKIQSKHALFLFDSCFSGKLVSRGEIAVPPIIEESIAYPVRQFITAGAANQTVPDESIFRRAFIRGLEGEADLNKDGFILGSELASYLRDKVTNYSSRQQTPLYAKIDDINLDRGDFVFVIPNKNVLTPTQIAWNNFEDKARNLIKYSEIYGYSMEEPVRVTIGDWRKGKKAMVDKFGVEIVSPKYSTLLPFQEGLARACKENLGCGFIDKTDQLVIPLKYEDSESFSEGLAAVKFDGKWGFINKSAIFVIKPKYENVEPFSEGLAVFKSGDRYGFIDKSGKEVISPIYDFAYSFSEGLSVITLSGKRGFIDKTGKIVIPIKYDFAESFSNGLASVGFSDGYMDGKHGYIDKSGKIIIPIKYGAANRFFDGLAAVLDFDSGNWGFINKLGKVILPLEYESVFQSVNPKDNYFQEGFATIEKDKKWGFADITGKIVIPIKYDIARPFSNGFAYVALNGKKGIIDKTGKAIVAIKYDEIWWEKILSERFFGVTLNGRKGFVDIYGNEYFDF
jgi:hypothetical protein